MPRYTFQVPAHTSLPLPSKLRQIDGLQVLRAAAVIEVALGHSGQNLKVPRTGGLDFGILGVDIFFVISGFILSSVVLRETGRPGLGTMWNFLKRRIIRIFPIYWIFSALIVIRMLWSHQRITSSYIPSILLLPSPTHIQTPVILAFAWTLFFEMFFYYALAIILIRWVKSAVPMLIAALVVFVMLGRFTGIRQPVLNVVCNPMLLEFVFGAAFALGYAKLSKRRSLGIAMVSAGMALCIYFGLHAPRGAAIGVQMIMNGDGVFLRVMTWGLGAAFIVGGIVFWAPAFDSWVGRLLVVLGTASYSSYLASPIVIEYVSRILLKVAGPPVGPIEIALDESVMVLSVLGLGWICYDLVEWPVIRKLQAMMLRKGI